MAECCNRRPVINVTVNPSKLDEYRLAYATAKAMQRALADEKPDPPAPDRIRLELTEGADGWTVFADFTRDGRSSGSSHDEPTLEKALKFAAGWIDMTKAGVKDKVLADAVASIKRSLR